MGLDTVELVMDIEREFDIKISDDDATNITTVGALIRYVARRKDLQVDEVCEPEPLSYCATASAFYSLRRLLVTQLDVPRRAIRPCSRVLYLVPDSHRTALMKHLNLWGARRRMLQGPEPGVLLVASLVASAALVGALFFLKLKMLSFVPAIGVILLIAFIVCGVLILRRLLVVSQVCIADVARQRAYDIEQEWVAEESLRIECEVAQNVPITNSIELNRIRSRVYEFVADQFGVKGEDLSDATHFVRDLGA